MCVRWRSDTLLLRLLTISSMLDSSRRPWAGAGGSRRGHIAAPDARSPQPQARPRAFTGSVSAHSDRLDYRSHPGGKRHGPCAFAPLLAAGRAAGIGAGALALLLWYVPLYY